MIASTINKTYGITCCGCGRYESLGTSQRDQADRKLRELGWRSTSDGMLCLACAANAPQLEETFTPRQVATELGVSMSSVWRWCLEGKLKAERNSLRSWRIRRSDIDQFLTSMAEPEMLSPAQAARVLSCSATYVRKLCEQGKLPSTIGINGYRQILRADVEKFASTPRERSVAKTIPQQFAEARARVASDLRDASTPVLRHAFFDLYEPQKLRGKSPKTKIKYIIELDRFDRTLGHPATIDDLTDDAISLVLGSMVEDGSAAPTANKFRSCILSLWRFLARKGVVKHWPDVEKLTEPSRMPRAWTEQQLGQLFNACRNVVGRIGGLPACNWWVALHAVAWDTGERIGAILEAQWSDADLDTGWLLIRAATRKGKRADQVTQLHPNTVALLRRIQRDAGPIFPWDLSPASLYTHYRRILKRAGLPHDRKSKFHRLRKSVATHLTALGGNATEALGHSSPAVTAVYIDPTIARKQQPSDLLFRPDVVDWTKLAHASDAATKGGDA